MLPIMLLIKSTILFFIMILTLTASSLLSESNLKKKCETCEDISKNFVLGLARTAKANFGGGNTHWEESRLGSFRFSETRLVDIQETLCKSNTRHGDAVCHSMAEEHEENIEEWWFKVYQKAPDSADLRQWLCVDKLEVCCPFARYGSKCVDCFFCGGRGSCRGNGTRSGDGGCDCESGYQGANCNECSADRYAAEKSDSSGLLRCEFCPTMCDGCTGPQSHDCLKCASGYQNTSDGVCQDVDECKDGLSSCQANEFCVNKAGSFSCQVCDKSCSDGCTAEGDGFCNKCSLGFELRDGRCQDVDECGLEGHSICNAPHEVCSNTVGSFSCLCDVGFQRRAIDEQSDFVTNQPCVSVATSQPEVPQKGEVEQLHEEL